MRSAVSVLPEPVAPATRRWWLSRGSGNARVRGGWAAGCRRRACSRGRASSPVRGRSCRPSPAPSLRSSRAAGRRRGSSLVRPAAERCRAARSRTRAAARRERASQAGQRCGQRRRSSRPGPAACAMEAVAAPAAGAVRAARAQRRPPPTASSAEQPAPPDGREDVASTAPAASANGPTATNAARASSNLELASRPVGRPGRERLLTRQPQLGRARRVVMDAHVLPARRGGKLAQRRQEWAAAKYQTCW